SSNRRATSAIAKPAGNSVTPLRSESPRVIDFDVTPAMLETEPVPSDVRRSDAGSTSSAVNEASTGSTRAWRVFEDEVTAMTLRSPVNARADAPAGEG